MELRHIGHDLRGVPMLEGDLQDTHGIGWVLCRLIAACLVGAVVLGLLQSFPRPLVVVTACGAGWWAYATAFRWRSDLDAAVGRLVSLQRLAAQHGVAEAEMRQRLEDACALPECILNGSELYSPDGIRGSLVTPISCHDPAVLLRPLGDDAIQLPKQAP
jgi:hypothetical protein